MAYLSKSVQYGQNTYFKFSMSAASMSRRLAWMKFKHLIFRLMMVQEMETLRQVLVGGLLTDWLAIEPAGHKPEHIILFLPGKLVKASSSLPGMLVIATSSLPGKLVIATSSLSGKLVIATSSLPG